MDTSSKEMCILYCPLVGIHVIKKNLCSLLVLNTLVHSSFFGAFIASFDDSKLETHVMRDQSALANSVITKLMQTTFPEI